MTVSGRSAGLIGLVAMLAGLVFAAQGAGWFPYPSSSFMVGRTPWVGRGLLLAAGGAAVLLTSRRRR